ncbi:hypothetical protein PVAND_011102 [Polypedilum vanderplanki]|uniref:C2H2-type domain-containing protein n=1 Tax=Polypedilum vanderplanki TaxID=319348 RepID=A0A9J6CIY9_POLVA|nr:hypothetical protein PVAND_011102 [Polypedilum vanderplanki]
MIKTDIEEVYDPYMCPLLDLQEPFEMHPQQQGNFNFPYYQHHNQAQQIRQQQHYLHIRQDQQRHLQHQQQIHQQQILRQEQLRMQQPHLQHPPQMQAFHQTAFRSNSQFQQQTGWRPSTPTQNQLVRLLPRVQPREQHPSMILQRQQPNWIIHNIRPQVQPPKILHPITVQDDLPPLVPLECEISPVSEEFDQAPINNNDDFKDFDVTDLLYLSFADDKNENKNRKRKGQLMTCSSQSKRRRTKAEIIADKNRSLKQLCVDFSIKCERLTTTSSHVRIFGNKIFRENLPNIPNMKLSPKTIDFIRIRNLGYMVTKKGVCFSCLGPDCKFKSYDQNRFREHLEKFHKIDESGTQEGFCEICKRNCCGFNVIDEFIHIKYFHAKIIDKHPMHQILYSHIVNRTKLEEDEAIIELDESSNSLFLNESDDEFEELPRDDNKADQLILTNDFDDDDYHPSSSEEDEEIENESTAETSDDNFIATSESEAKLTSDEDDEEEIPDLSSSDEEHRKKKKLRTNKTEDEIPQYILDRIKNHSTSKSNNSEVSQLLNESFNELIEDLMNENLPKTSKEQKKRKKKKRKERNFARKSTSKCKSQIQFYSITSPPNLRPCQVVLTRCDVQKILNSNIEILNTNKEISETTKEISSPINGVQSQTRESLKMIIKKTDKNIQIVVPDIPTPPSSEDSRDSLPTPPLNKSTEKNLNYAMKKIKEENNECEAIKENLNDENVESIQKSLDMEVLQVNEIEDKNSNDSLENDTMNENPTEEISKEKTSEENKENEILNDESKMNEIRNEENEVQKEQDNVKEIIEKDKILEDTVKLIYEVEQENKQEDHFLKMIIVCEDETVVDKIEENQNHSQENQVQSESVKVMNQSKDVQKEPEINKNELGKDQVQVQNDSKMHQNEKKKEISSEDLKDESDVYKTSKETEIENPVGAEILNQENYQNEGETITLSSQESTSSVEIITNDKESITSILIDSKESTPAPIIEIDCQEPKSTIVIDSRESSPTTIVDSEEIISTIVIDDTQILTECKKLKNSEEKSICIEIADDDDKLTTPKSRKTRNFDKAKGIVNSIKNYFSPQKSSNKQETSDTINDAVNNNEEVENLSTLYPWIDKSVSSTVYKTKRCINELKNEFCQFSTYKCMKKNCSFYTTEEKKFETHTSTHNGDHHFCSFCLFDGVNSVDLCQHIEKLHRHDRYQCNLCMYRASEKVYVEWHQKRFHKDMKGKILKSPAQSLMKSVRNRVQDKLKNENREKFVKPYDCKNTKEGNNQCLYCEYGSDNKDEIQVHLTDNHPYELGFICRRKLSSEIEAGTIETLENATLIEYIGHSTFKVKFYTEARAKLTKEDESTSINVENILINEEEPEEATKTKETSEIVDLIKEPIPKTSSIPIIDKIIHIDST